MAVELDLTQHSTTLRGLPIPHIPRDNLVRWLQDRFTEERKVIIVQGPDGAGKTVLLTYFVNTYRNRCFSFFVRADILSTPKMFLLEMCAQMDRIVGTRKGEIDDSLSYRELREQFQILYRRAAKRARRAKEPFYFVVDGLEHVVESHGEESILDLLPKDPPSGIYLLASSTCEKDVPFDHDSWSIPLFSLAETETYFQDMELDQQTVKEIYDKCEGMPGYLAQIRREIQSGLPLEKVLADLPKGFRHLLEREWKRANIKEEHVLKALAVLTYAELPLDIVQLASIVGARPDTLERNLASVPFVQAGSGQRLAFVTDAHRRFVADQLTDRRVQAEAMLIRYYEQEPFSQESLRQLPVLYKQSDYWF